MNELLAAANRLAPIFGTNGVRVALTLPLSGMPVKVTYDQRTDTLTVILKQI